MSQSHKDDGENPKTTRLLENTNLENGLGPENLTATKPKGRSFVLALSLALVLHLTMVLLFGLLEPHVSPKNRPLQAEVTFRESRKMAATRQINPKEQKPVVMVAPSATPQRPPNAKFFAETDQSAEIEEAATHTSLDPPALSAAPEKMGTLSPKSSEQALAETAKQQPSSAEATLSEIGQKTPSIDDYLAPAKKTTSPDPLGIRPKTPGNSHRDAMPFADELPNIKKGEKTQLNTWQWLHAPFFNRIKSKVAKVWSPQRQMARYDPTGSLIGQKDRVTVMRVLIDRQGVLKSITVAASSGVAYLDEEAERAFRMAAPFPFPPKELFDEKGLFAFDFSFHLQIDNGLSFDFDWNPAS